VNDALIIGLWLAGAAVALTLLLGPPARLRRRGVFGFLDVGGPPVVEVPQLEGLQIRSDPAELAATLLDAEVMALARQTLATAYDELDLQPNRLRIDCRLESGYFPDEDSIIDEALRSAWKLGTAIVERLEPKG